MLPLLLIHLSLRVISNSSMRIRSTDCSGIEINTFFWRAGNRPHIAYPCTFPKGRRCAAFPSIGNRTAQFFPSAPTGFHMQQKILCSHAWCRQFEKSYLSEGTQCKCILSCRPSEFAKFRCFDFFPSPCLPPQAVTPSLTPFPSMCLPSPPSLPC